MSSSPSRHSNPMNKDTVDHHRKTIQTFMRVRQDSELICEPLKTEDFVIQAMADVSPPKWHLAHTTWFFENFILIPFLKDYKVFHPMYAVLFNSYYTSVGEYFPRPQRGQLSRPTVEEIYQYRAYVDSHMQVLCTIDDGNVDNILARLVLGINHEQQHQELLLTDIKYNNWINPLRPAYKELKSPPSEPVTKMTWGAVKEGLYLFGHQETGFAYDNETPSHKRYLDNSYIASRLVTNGEYLAFIEDRGYANPKYWLSEGWNAVNRDGWAAPLYWEKMEGVWYYMTFSGMKPIDWNAPVCHVSYFEADAFAQWAGKRLPTEFEWEILAKTAPKAGNLRDMSCLQPKSASAGSQPLQFFGDTWEWTKSGYESYPGFQTLAESLGEYNGKFMNGQMVLRGGSCVTPQDHIRHTYRNFFYPADRWQFSGIRLAEDLS